MRLGYAVRAVFPQHGYGGLERSSSGLMHHLLLRGVDVALFTQPLPANQPFQPREDWRGRLTVHPVRYGRMPLRPNGIPARLVNYRAFTEDIGARIDRLARKDYIDGIYAHGLCAWGVRRAAEWGVPMAANPHGMEEFKVRHPLKRLAYAPFRRWVRAGCRAADRVIATDHAMRAEVSSLLGVEPARVAVIPNGIDLDEARSLVDPGVQRKLAEMWPLLRRGGDVLKGISVGRLEANKGFEYLLRALAMCRNELGEDWLWVVVGDGSLRASLEALKGELGLGEHVFFAGSLSDAELHSMYALCNLFVHPTLYEGSSLVTLEAMCHGLAVVASAVGGIPDKVEHGVSGFLARPGDAAQLACRIAWTATHERERSLMGARGAELVEKFSWVHVAAQTEQLFMQLLDQKAACRPHKVALA